MRWQRRCESPAVTLCKTAQPSEEKSKGVASWRGGPSSITCFRGQNKESAAGAGRGGCAAWSEDGEQGARRKNTAEPAAEDADLLSLHPPHSLFLRASLFHWKNNLPCLGTWGRLGRLLVCLHSDPISLLAGRWGRESPWRRRG